MRKSRAIILVNNMAPRFNVFRYLYHLSPGLVVLLVYHRYHVTAADALLVTVPLTVVRPSTTSCTVM